MSNRAQPQTTTFSIGTLTRIKQFMEESDDLIDSICPSLKEEVMRATKEAAQRLNWVHPELLENNDN